MIRYSGIGLQATFRESTSNKGRKTNEISADGLSATCTFTSCGDVGWVGLGWLV